MLFLTAGGPLVMWNMSDRTAPKGIFVGQAGKTEVLSIPQEFDSVKHYGVVCQLTHVEVKGWV